MKISANLKVLINTILFVSIIYYMSQRAGRGKLDRDISGKAALN
jgi:hypothetical protein